MKIGRILVCLILLLCGAAANAEETPLPASPAVDETSENCGVDPATATPDELAEWAESAGGSTQPQPQYLGGGSVPPCPSVVPVCAGLIPISCPPSTTCKKTRNCSSQDMGYSSCEIAPNILFTCSLGQTVHKTSCACASSCPDAMCGNRSDLTCQ